MFRQILIAYVFFAILSFVMYLPKIVQFCYAFKKPPHKKATGLRKIGLVIPALDESKVIGDLFDSIEKQDYDRAYFDVNVIVKDPTDPTVAMAKALGYNVFIVPNQTCKGEALDGCFKQIPQESFDGYAAFVIIDADAVLASDYVTELNNALEHDFDIFLTRKFIKNYLGDRKQRTIFSNCSALTYPMLDTLGNNYRMERGLPMNMCGQGMMVRRSVIDELGGWPYRTLTEDYELKLDSVLHGFRSMYYPYAFIYTEEVLRHKEAYNRRLRWVTGYSQCDRIYKKQVKMKIKKRGPSGAEWFEYFFALVPLIIFIVATILTMAGGTALALYHWLHGLPWLKDVIFLIVMPFGIMYGLEFWYSLLAMLSYRDVFKPLSGWEKLGMLLFSPLFMLEYFPIFIQSRIRAKKGMNWQPTKHEEYEKGVAEKALEQQAELKNAQKEDTDEKEQVS